MAKIQIKSEELTPFGGIFSIMEQLKEGEGYDVDFDHQFII